MIYSAKPMAKITPTPNVAQIVGSAGASSYARWRSINIMKQRVTEIHSDPHSDKQDAFRAAVSALVNHWNFTLDSTQRGYWEMFAKIKNNQGSSTGGTLTIIKGNTGTGTGYHAFMSANLLLRSVGIDVATSPQTDPNPTNARPNPITDFAVTHDNVNHWFEFTWVKPVNYLDSYMIRIWIYDPTQIAHRQIYLTADAGDEAATGANFITGLLGVSVPFLGYPDGVHFHFQADVVCIDSGLVSSPSATIEGIKA